ncbi:hypothetical protein SDC9_126661 [bioreactor metagenome]|uniref:Uncharacterized protein n=1 Tax=bioreactor metagenome TaxID=1076179 RepID=A0A645CSF2_9ZZZZ
MNVSVDKAGGEILALRVKDFRALADGIVHIAHGGNFVSRHRNAAVINFSGENVYDLAVFHHQIGRLFPARHRQQLLIHSCSPAFLK